MCKILMNELQSCLHELRLNDIVLSSCPNHLWIRKCVFRFIKRDKIRRLFEGLVMVVTFDESTMLHKSLF